MKTINIVSSRKGTIQIGGYTFRPYPDRPKRTPEEEIIYREKLRIQREHEESSDKLSKAYKAAQDIKDKEAAIQAAIRKAEYEASRIGITWDKEDIKALRHVAKQIKELIKDSAFAIDDNNLRLFTAQHELLHKGMAYFVNCWYAYMGDYIYLKADAMCEYIERCELLLYNYALKHSDEEKYAEFIRLSDESNC